MLKPTIILLIAASFSCACAPLRLSARQSLRESNQKQRAAMDEMLVSVNTIKSQLADLISRSMFSDTSDLMVETEKITECFSKPDSLEKEPVILSRTTEKTSARKKYGVNKSAETTASVASFSSDTLSIRETVREQSKEVSASDLKIDVKKKTGLSWYQKGLIYLGSITLAYGALNLALKFYMPQSGGILTLLKNLLNKIKI